MRCFSYLVCGYVQGKALLIEDEGPDRFLHVLSEIGGGKKRDGEAEIGFGNG